MTIDLAFTVRNVGMLCTESAYRKRLDLPDAEREEPAVADTANRTGVRYPTARDLHHRAKQIDVFYLSTGFNLTSNHPGQACLDLLPGHMGRKNC